MTIQEARNMVILAGKKLVETGLIARTWGNVSCRVSDSHFVITPSGRDYLSLSPDEIVEVAVSDCSYNGDIKPSSEKGVHALVYCLRPEVNFIIHTHQDNASAVSASQQDSIKVSQEDFPSLHGEVICASYGLPGTKKLRRNVEQALMRSSGNAVIMKNHGALCFGTGYEETFKTAHELEAACERFIMEQYCKNNRQPATDPLEIGAYALSKITGAPVIISKNNPAIFTDSERNDSGLHEIHREIYKNNKNINYILYANTPGIKAVSCAGIKLLPLLDDFAQIAGISVNNVEMDPRKISASLKSASAVLIKNNGALCCGFTKSDAQALSMVLEKNCKAYISAALCGGIKPINSFECRLMRFIYLKKYSKLYKLQK